MFCLQSIATKRLVSYCFSKGRLPDLELYKLSEICSEENILSVEQDTVGVSFSNETIQSEEVVAPYLMAIDQSICRMVRFKIVKY